MTFRELAFQEDLKLSSSLLNGEADKGIVQEMLANQSPLMKGWFVIMMVNLLMFLFLIH